MQERKLTSGSATARCDVFLSYRGRDRDFVAQIAERLRGEGLDPWFDQWSLTAGKRWQRELEDALARSRACAVFVGASDLLSASTGQAPVGDVSAWQREELDVALSRAAREPGFRVIPVLLPGVGDPFDPNELPAFLSTRTWVDFRRGPSDRRALQDLINATRGLPVGAHSAVCRREVKAPYRGLRAFDEQDADVFFGRDSELQRLVEMLKSRRFVAVIGASGCGKSSLVRAGLVPWLRANVAGGGPDAPIAMLRPGAAPLAALAAQLASLDPGRAMGATLDALADDARSLRLSAELVLADRSADERVVVIVDQLEEVFTRCHDEAQRSQLFALLLDAALAPGARTVVIVTMRDDFYGRCAAHPAFAQLIASQQLLVGQMDADGLRQAIERPARQAGLVLEEGLADTGSVRGTV